MFGFFISLLLLLTGLVLKRKRGTWISPEVIFCFQWSLVSFLASLHLFGMYEARDFTWLIVLFGSFSYVLGVLLVSPTKIKSRAEVKDSTPFFNVRTFWFITVLLYVFSIQDFIQAYRFLSVGYDLGEIRLASYGIEEISGYQRNTAGIYALFYAIKDLFRLLMIAVGIHYFTQKPSKNYYYLFAVFGFVFLEASTNGGRFGFAYLIVELLVCFTLLGNLNRYNRKFKLSKFSLYVPIVALLSAIVYISVERGWDSDAFGVKFYRYICGNIVFFDRHIDNFEGAPLYIVWSSLYGFWSLILPVLHTIGLPYPDMYLQAIKEVFDTQNFMQIGDDMYTNAFITPFYHLYADGRLVGVILGMLIFGIVSGKVYVNARISCNGRNLIFYLIICQMIFKSITIYPFAANGYALALLFFCFFKKRSFNIF